MLKVLFVCVQNSARSQMAEAFVNRLGNGRFVAESAGISKGKLNPYVVRAMTEAGYDIRDNPVDSVFDFFKDGRQYDLVIKVCDESAGQQCPVFPSAALTLIWSFADPSQFTGSDEQIMSEVRTVRDEIERRINEMLRVLVISKMGGSIDHQPE